MTTTGTPDSPSDGATGPRRGATRARAGRPARREALRRHRADAVAAHLEPVVEVLPLQDRPREPGELRSWLAEAVQSTGTERMYECCHPRAAPPARPAAERTQGRASLSARGHAWFLRHVWNAPGVVFVVATGAALVAYVAFTQQPAWRMPVLCGFLVVLPTLLPGFLYLRFITSRIGPLCEEYVYNLHRLGVDEPRYLPEPPRASAAWNRWYDSGGPLLREVHNIYRAKFETQYGRWPASQDDAHKESLGRLLSVYLCLITLGIGWAGVVWTAPVADELPRLADALRFGFLGAYFFLMSLLIRRYFQNDLRPGAYLSGVVRLATVLVLVVAVDQVFAMQGAPADTPHAALNVTAFVIGVFPSVAMQLLRRSIGTFTGWFRGGLEPPFPLTQLDGMDIWSEARLLEVGIEDVQHLATANFVDVCLGARIPTQRLVDWVDQALLLLRTGLPRTDNVAQPTTYQELRGIGVRSATDLLDLVDDLGLDLSPGGPWPAQESAVGALATVPAAPPAASPKRGDVRPSTVPLLTRMALAATTLRHESNLPLVRNWHETAPEALDDERSTDSTPPDPTPPDPTPAGRTPPSSPVPTPRSTTLDAAH